MRTRDAKFIREVMTHPKIWPHISDDNSGSPDTFTPVIDDRYFYLAPEHSGMKVGVFLYHPHTPVLYEVHTCVLPSFWGPAAIEAARAGLKWMALCTGCRKVITHVPVNNRLARRFALAVGMVEEGLNRQSFLKGGEMLDQHILGITKGEILSCQPQR